MNSDTLYLTSTGRLARRLRHRFRMRCIEDGMRGWHPPQAMSLNAWLQNVWTESWPERVPASDILRTSLWYRLTSEIPPPSPFERDLGLCSLLDENYGVMIRHGIEPAAGFPSTPLVEWRRGISRAFKVGLDREGFFHPAELPILVSGAISTNAAVCPGKISLSGFESPAPIETDLFSLLEKKAPVEYCEAQRGKPEALRAVALPSPEQEVRYLIHCLAGDARSLPLSRIGVIAPDLQACASILEEGLKAVLGDNPSQGSQWFNITLGKSLHDSPLIKAALLPLRFLTEREPRDIFLSLLLSPYYGCWQGHRHAIARADRVWRECSIESGLGNMIASLTKRGSTLPEKILAGGAGNIPSFCKIRPGKPGEIAFWITRMTALWSDLGFPVISDEKDTLAWRHLQNILNDMQATLSKERMPAQEFLAWLTHVISRKKTQTSASEEAGIQVMGLIESRGLDFEKIYILDMNDRSLPQPVRPLPLLDTSERRVVQGGTAPSQYDFARNAFQGILGSAPRVTLLRAEQKDGKPLTPSPFWPGSEIQESIDIWRKPDPAWLRVDWLRSSFQGLNEADGRDMIADFRQKIAQKDLHPDPDIVPQILSPSDMERALKCPYIFFVSRILKIDELERIQQGVSPKERGIRLHRILASFTKGTRNFDPDLFSDREAALDLLTRCVTEEFRDVERDPHWQVERKLLMDSGESIAPGLLVAWLDEEIRHRQDGWQCIAEETGFADLGDGSWPFSLRGRIDRIDYMKDRGIVCWDYKTGNIPTAGAIVDQFTSPQLPLYLLAIRTGKVAGMKKYVKIDLPVSAGYMQLKSLKAVRIQAIDTIESSLDAWIGVISDLGKILKRGDFPARPFPVSLYEKRNDTCRDCSLITVCEKGIYLEKILNS